MADAPDHAMGSESDWELVEDEEQGVVADSSDCGRQSPQEVEEPAAEDVAPKEPEPDAVAGEPESTAEDKRIDATPDQDAAEPQELAPTKTAPTTSLTRKPAPAKSRSASIHLRRRNPQPSPPAPSPPTAPAPPSTPPSPLIIPSEIFITRVPLLAAPPSPTPRVPPALATHSRAAAQHARRFTHQTTTQLHQAYQTASRQLQAHGALIKAAAYWVLTSLLCLDCIWNLLRPKRRTPPYPSYASIYVPRRHARIYY